MKLTVTMSRWEKILGWVLLALHLLFLPILIALVCSLLSIRLTNATLNIATFVAAWVLSIAIFHRFLWQNLRTFRQDLKKSLYAALGGFGIYYVLNIFVNIVIMNISPDYANVNDANIAEISNDYYLAMLVCTVLLVPVTEELLYRGMLFGLFHRRSRLLAYVMSTLIFAAIHVVGYIGTAAPADLLIGLFQYIPACIGLAYAYEKADSIWASILMHGTVNLIGMLAMQTMR